MAGGRKITNFFRRSRQKHEAADSSGSHPEPAAAAAASPQQNRKHWRVDTKWLFGIPATVILMALLAVAAFFVVSGREQAYTIIDDARMELVSDYVFRQNMQQVAPQMLARMDSPEFVDYLYEDPKAFEQEVNALVPQVNEDELPEGVEAPEADPRAQQAHTTLSIYVTAVKIISGPSHEGAGSLLTVSLILLLATGVPFLILSYRIGRLVSAGVALAIASLPALLVVDALGARLVEMEWEGIATEAGSQALVGMLMAMAHGVTGEIRQLYMIFFLASLGILVAAAAGYAAIRLYHWRKNRAPRIHARSASPAS